MSHELPPEGGPFQPGQPADPTQPITPEPTQPIAPQWSAPGAGGQATQPGGYSQPGAFDAQPGGTPEYLDSGSGAPIPAGSVPARSRRTALIGASVAGVAVLGAAGAWAFSALSGGGPQPTEALPADTAVLISVDLDPSASQKIEAIKTMQKFPGFKDNVKVDPKDDLRRKLYDYLQEQSGCDHLDYGGDVGNWIGDRVAFGARSGDGSPEGYLAIAVTDEKAADAGLAKINHCSATGDADKAGETSEVGWAVDGGWAVVSTSDKVAKDVLADGQKKSLADDATYQKWTDELGDPGIVSFYAAPGAADLLVDGMRMAQGGLDSMTGLGAGADPSAAIAEGLKDFKGGAATLRFADGTMEFEAVGDGKAFGAMYTEASAGPDLISSLPDDTAAALAVKLPKGWAQRVVDSLEQTTGQDGLSDELNTSLESELGLSFPEDVETLLGDSTTISLGGDFDVNTMSASTDGTGIPVGFKVHGDSAKIEAILDKLQAKFGSESGNYLNYETDGDVVVIGPDPSYRELLGKSGGLGSTSEFKAVVPAGSDASSTLFVNFDAHDWLAELADSDAQARANVEPLSGVAVSSWSQGGTAHVLFKLTTD